MRVQTDRYNWSVPIPLDLTYALGLIAGACILLLAAAYYSGVHRESLSANPSRLFAAVVRRADEVGMRVTELEAGCPSGVERPEHRLLRERVVDTGTDRSLHGGYCPRRLPPQQERGTAGALT